MESNPILTEIRQTRDHLAQACGHDLHALAARIQAREAEERAAGIPFATLVEPSRESGVVREEPPTK